MIDQRHAVIALHGAEVGQRVLAEHLLVFLHERLVQLVPQADLVVMHGDDALYRVTHQRHRVVLHHVAGDEQLDAGFHQAARLGLLHEGDGHVAARVEAEHRVGLGLHRALQVGGELHGRDGGAGAADHLAAALLEAFLEPRLRVDARRVVGYDAVGGLHALLGGVLAQHVGQLRQGERHPHEIRRAFGDDGCGRVDDDGGLLRLGQQAGRGHGVGREAVAQDDVHLLAQDQLLRHAAGQVAVGGALVVAGDKLHRKAGGLVGVHGLEDLDAVLVLPALVGEGAGERQDDADGQGAGGEGGRDGGHAGGGQAQGDLAARGMMVGQAFLL